jgi:hypothetical protein
VTERPLPPADDAVAATGERQDPGAARHGSPQPAKESRKPNEIRSISELLTYVYSRAGRSFSITPKVRKALADDAADPRALTEQITRLATSDPILAVPPKVLTAMERARVGGRLRKTLLGLMALPLRQHSGLASIDLAAALSDEPTPDHDALFRSVREALSRPEPGHLGKASLRPADRRTLQNNAVLSVALLVAIKHDWPTTALADCLDTYLWQEDLAATKVLSERALLTDGTSPAALALVARAWRGRLSEQVRKVREAEAEVHDARRRWQEALSHASAMAEAREQMEKVIAEREEVIAGLQREVASEREHRRIEKSHAVDDYERLRSQLVRGLVQQTSLLEDGLHALRNSRVGVTEEYVERVIESLREDLQRLRDGAKKDRSE